MPEGTDAQVPSPVRETHPQPEVKEREGLRVNFTINNRHLISHTLSRIGEHAFSSTEHQGDIVALQNFTWRVSQPCYDFVAGRLQPGQFFAQGGTLEDVSAFLDQVEQSGEFEKVREQTQAYLDTIKAQWERQYPETSRVIEDLTGLDLNRQITVLVTHPSLRNGQYLGNNTIAWGHREDWPNYGEVYLWHEIMHSYFDYSDLSHALIQFITDNHLRAALNQGETYPPFVGHESLFPLMEQMLPRWQAYLQDMPEGGKRDIQTFQAKLKAIPEFQEKERQPQSQIIEE